APMLARFGSFEIDESRNPRRLPPADSRLMLLTFDLRSIRFIELSSDAMRTPSSPGQQVLSDRGENLSSVLLAIFQDHQRRKALLSWIQELTPNDVVDLEFPEDLNGKVLVHLVEKDGRKISAESASEGTLRFLALLAVLFSPNRENLYFFEE